MDDSKGIEGFSLGLISGFLVGFSVACLMWGGTTVSYQVLVDKGYAYYNPTNKEFTWKENK